MATADGDLPEEETCATCGGLLSRTGPKGGCLRCLLGVAFATDEGPPTVVPPSSKSQWAVRRSYGHFSIDTDQEGMPVELGAGATATTYRARDQVLRSAVALKVTHKSVLGRPAARERFLREARAAAKLRHPNIASVSYYGEEEGECYYAMELIEGETLEARVLREGPLAPMIALEVGIQVACALAAAEACGVVHRDLKPSNLMLTASPGRSDEHAGSFTVKVIDWGLAKAANDDPVLGADHTRDGFVGTPAFASPEQFLRNEDQRIDTRSDIYSLGVTLWYLICGCAPFVGDTLEIIRIQQREPPFKPLATKRTPGPLMDVLAAMLAPNPAARPQSSRELLEMLRRCRQRVATGRLRFTGARRPWLTVTCTLLALLATVAGIYWYQSSSAISPSEYSIAVLSFDDPSLKDTEASFARGLRDEIARNLAQVAAFRVTVINGAHSAEMADQDLRRLGTSLGSRFVLAGSVHREGEQVRVKTRLLEAEGSRQLWNGYYDKQRNDVFSVPGMITRSVASYLRVNLTKAEQTAILAPLTVDAAAYELYIRVHHENLFYRTEAERDRYEVDVALPALEEAVRLDPKFVLAYCELASAHGALIHCEPATMQAEARTKHRLQAEAALAVARRLRPDSGEVHLALARHFSYIVRDAKEAQIELELAQHTLPASAALESLVGGIANAQNRWEEAVRCYERAVIMDPHDAEARGVLVYLYQSMRRYDDCERTAAQLSAVDPRDALAQRLIKTLSTLEARADLVPLKSILDVCSPSERRAQPAIDQCELMLALFEHDPDKVSRLLDATAQDRIRIRGVSYPKTWFVALAARLRGDYSGTQTAFEQARVEAEHTVQIDPMNGRALGLLAMIDAGLGRRDQAVREAIHAGELCTVETSADQAPVVACDLAAVYAWTDQPELACAVLEEWSRRPAGFNLPRQPTYGDLKLNPLWLPIREHPRFVALTTQLAPPALR